MNPTLRLAHRLCLGLLLLALALPALPQRAPAQYTVEVIVFRTGDAAGALPAGSALPGGGDDLDATSATSRRLGGAATRLRNAGGYRVLAHTAWTQAPTAWLQGPPAVTSSRRGVSASRLGMSNAGVQGKFVVERGTYLHFGMDLVVEDGGQRYQLNELRRVRLDEVQYFDHPAIGVIAVVSAASN